MKSIYYNIVMYFRSCCCSLICFGSIDDFPGLSTRIRFESVCYEMNRILKSARTVLLETQARAFRQFETDRISLTFRRLLKLLKVMFYVLKVLCCVKCF